MRINPYAWWSVTFLTLGAWMGACGGSEGVTPGDGIDASADGGASANEAGGDTSTNSNGDADNGDANVTDAQSSIDGGSSGDAGPGGTITTLPCGAATCSIPAQTCCVSSTGQNGRNFSCVTGTSCPGQVDAGGGGGDVNTAGLKCASQANCAAGTVCCFTVDSNGRTLSSSCTAGIACPSAHHQLCDPNAGAGATGCASDAGTCTNDNHGDFGLPATFGACGGFPN